MQVCKQSARALEGRTRNEGQKGIVREKGSAADKGDLGPPGYKGEKVMRGIIVRLMKPGNGNATS